MRRWKLQRMSKRTLGSPRLAGSGGGSPKNWAAHLKPSAGTGVRAAVSPRGNLRRIGVLDGQYNWLKKMLLAHNGNADGVRQEHPWEKGIAVSMRAVERAVEPWR